MCVVSLFHLIAIAIEDAQSRKENQELIDLVVIEREPVVEETQIQLQSNGQVAITGTGDTQDGEDVDPVAAALTASIPILVDFDALQAQNPDVVAWIYCEDTVINYPILQGDDNQYYVNHSVNGTRNASGALFMDFRNTEDFHDLNSVIYGHNMNDGSMFGILTQYKKQAFYEKNPVIWLLTPECAYRVDPVAGFVARSDDRDTFCFYDTQEEMRRNLARQMEKSVIETPITDPSGVKQLITLSTCSYEHPTARFVLVGSMTAAQYPDKE